MKQLIRRLDQIATRMLRSEHVLIRRNPVLFDTRFYRLMYPDVADRDLDPIWHYLRYGAAEGRDPSAVFNTAWYRRQMPGDAQDMNPLVHFIRFGAAHGLSPTPFFDPVIYARRNRDVVRKGHDLFAHFIRYGLRENRAASDLFNPVRYLQENPDARMSDLPALAHYLLYGEGRGALPMHYNPLYQRDKAGVALDYPPDLMAAIQSLPPQSARGAAIDVIVPVYRAREETLSCLWHVLRAREKTAFELVVIDDCSPEPDLSVALDRLAESGHVTLLRNEENLGFVKSVNRGMALHPDRDVILLNSDTEVYSGWVDRLHRHAQSDRQIGTLTPLTNNGQICSYPHSCADNPHLLEITPEELDRIAARVNAEADPVPAPTAVGFAMYIRRKTLDMIGPFDEDAFGTGYGEENDFCQRAREGGWLDMIAPDVVIRHLGSMSFQDEKPERVAHAMEVIRVRYPDYDAQVQRFIRRDPLRAHRARIDEVRLKRLVGAENVLVISHGRGGGTEQAIRMDSARMTAAGISVFRMGVAPPHRTQVRHSHHLAPDLPNMQPLDILTQRDEIIALWRELGISRIDLHHSTDFGRFGAGNLLGLLRDAGLPWRYHIHDYMVICPRMNLADERGVYCGEPDADGCRDCIKARHTAFGTVDINWWRAQHEPLLQEAEACIVPDPDVALRLGRYFPQITFQVVPHDTPRIPPARPPRKRRDGPLRVGTIGAISEIKGFSYLIDCARTAESTDLQFVVAGFTRDDDLARDVGIEVSGRYRHDDLPDLLARLDLDVILQISRLPETYSFTLSAAIETGLPIVTFDIGAPQSRLRALEVPDAHILPLSTMPAAMVRYLQGLGSERAGQIQAAI